MPRIYFAAFAKTRYGQAIKLNVRLKRMLVLLRITEILRRIAGSESRITDVKKRAIIILQRRFEIVSFDVDSVPFYLLKI